MEPQIIFNCSLPSELLSRGNESLKLYSRPGIPKNIEETDTAH